MIPRRFLPALTLALTEFPAAPKVERGFHRIWATIRPERRAFVIGALALFAILPACATLDTRTQPPRVALESIRVQRLALTEVRFALGLAVENPNRYDLAVEALDVTVAIEGASFFTGALAFPVVLAARQVTPVEIEFKTSLIEWTTVLDRVARSLAARYEVTGMITLEGGTRLPYRRAGELPAIELPGARR